ncbi:MAG: YkvA family protein [Ignavibacteriaceae bacterium]|nr:YkvA family protein [Ignavibacteriaceae bacterium]
MKEKDFDIITPDDEIFENLGDLGAFRTGGKTEREVGEDYSERSGYVEENFWSKVERVGKKISFAKDIMALYKYMKDPFISWHRKAIVVMGLVYFISPIDTIPDIAPFIGYLDDLGVITAVIKFLGSELIPYYDAKYRK